MIHSALIVAINPLVPVIAGLIIAIIGPLGAYIVAARRFSGKIGTSDAAQLWEESRAIREWSKTRIAELEGRVTTLEGQGSSLKQEKDELKVEVRGLTQTIVELRAEIVGLTDELRKSHARVEQLEGEKEDDRRSG